MTDDEKLKKYIHFVEIFSEPHELEKNRAEWFAMSREEKLELASTFDRLWGIVK